MMMMMMMMFFFQWLDSKIQDINYKRKRNRNNKHSISDWIFWHVSKFGGIVFFCSHTPHSTDTLNILCRESFFMLTGVVKSFSRIQVTVTNIHETYTASFAKWFATKLPTILQGFLLQSKSKNSKHNKLLPYFLLAQFQFFVIFFSSSS